MDRLCGSLTPVIKLDAWLSFSAPLLIVVVVPVLVVLDAAHWLVATTVLVLAVILGGCGIIYAVVLCVGAARGHLEFPTTCSPSCTWRTSRSRGPRPPRSAGTP